MTLLLGILIGFVLLAVLRIVLIRLMLVKLRRDVAALNAGDHKPLLAGYAKDAVIAYRRLALEADDSCCLRRPRRRP